MRAVQADRPGGPEVLAVREVPAPVAGTGQVLVRAVATSLNPIDVKMRARETLTFPRTLGWDLAGVVVESNVLQFKPGDRVIAMSDPLTTGTGTWSDLVSLDGNTLASAPSKAALTESATLPLAGLTALQTWAKPSLPASARVLVVGAAGAIGGYLVQLAVQAGHTVDGLVSRPEHVSLARSLGADLVTNSPAELPDHAYDAVFDTAALVRTGIAVSRLLTETGEYVVTSKERPDLPRAHTVKVVPDANGLDQLARLVDEGRLRLRVSAHYPLHEVRDAHQHFEARGLRGKVVLIF